MIKSDLPEALNSLLTVITSIFVIALTPPLLVLSSLLVSSLSLLYPFVLFLDLFRGYGIFTFSYKTRRAHYRPFPLNSAVRRQWLGSLLVGTLFSAAAVLVSVLQFERARLVPALVLIALSYVMTTSLYVSAAAGAEKEAAEQGGVLVSPLDEAARFDFVDGLGSREGCMAFTGNLVFYLTAPMYGLFFALVMTISPFFSRRSDANGGVVKQFQVLGVVFVAILDAVTVVVLFFLEFKDDLPEPLGSGWVLAVVILAMWYVTTGVMLLDHVVGAFITGRHPAPPPDRGDATHVDGATLPVELV